ncbi:MAG: hypothetical protein K2K70_10385, partial [Lachnospiraceae bacterium]|nr:hypothetical protein [Lachnospiraceae bacterium]
VNASWDRHITSQIKITDVSSQTRQDWLFVFPWQAKISMWNAKCRQQYRYGALHVDKDYNILRNSILQMIRYEDQVYVGDNFSMASSSEESREFK